MKQHRSKNKFKNKFKFKARTTGRIPATGNTKDVEVAVTLEYWSNFRRTLEMSLIN